MPGSRSSLWNCKRPASFPENTPFPHTGRPHVPLCARNSIRRAYTPAAIHLRSSIASAAEQKICQLKTKNQPPELWIAPQFRRPVLPFSDTRARILSHRTAPALQNRFFCANNRPNGAFLPRAAFEPFAYSIFIIASGETHVPSFFMAKWKWEASALSHGISVREPSSVPERTTSPASTNGTLFSPQ